MRNIILSAFCILTIAVHSQQWEWAKTVNIGLPISTMSQVHLAPDKLGNVYLSYFHLTSNYLNPDGSTIAKYDPMGNELWQKNFSSKIRVKDIAADSFGSFYITGDFRDTIYVDSVSLISNGNNDAFLAKFNSNGNVQWIKNSGGQYNDCGGALCLDEGGYIYMTGEYCDSAAITGSSTYTVRSNVTLSKFDSSGNVIFFKSSNTPHSLQGSAQGQRIKLDNYGNIIVLGNFNRIQIDSFLLISGDQYGAQFICKFDATGQAKWLKEVISSTSRYNDFVLGHDNAIFATGWGSWTSGHWAFTDSFDTLGNTNWSKGCGLHCGYSRDDELNGVANDSVNIIAFGNGNCGRLLLVKYAYDGSLVFMDTIRSTNYIDGKCIVRDSNGQYIISGFIDGGITLGNDSIYSSTAKLFIAKFSDNSFITTIKNQNDRAELIRVFPNPSSGIFTVDLHNCQAEVEVVVRDVLGCCLYEEHCRNNASTVIDLSSQPKGIYFMEIVSDGKRSVNKIVLH